MTRTEAAEVHRMRDTLVALPPTHELAALRRAAAARLRKRDARGYREKPDASPLARLDADFSSIFGDA